MGKLIRRLSLVSSLTLLSRFLGLARDVLFFGLFWCFIDWRSVYSRIYLSQFISKNARERNLELSFHSCLCRDPKSKIKRESFSLIKSSHFPVVYLSGRRSLVIALFSYYASFSGFFEEAKWIEGAYLNSITFGYVVFICTSAIL